MTTYLMQSGLRIGAPVVNVHARCGRVICCSSTSKKLDHRSGLVGRRRLCCSGVVMRGIDSFHTTKRVPVLHTRVKLPLPPLLRDLLASGRWRQPPDEVIYAAVPFLREPVDFLISEAAMRSESHGLGVGFPHFREFRSSESKPQPLPWLDDDLALFIAVNREIGADIGIALDYRTSSSDPRVVASDWWSDDKTCYWREVTSTFTEFVARLGL